MKKYTLIIIGIAIIAVAVIAAAVTNVHPLIYGIMGGIGGITISRGYQALKPPKETTYQKPPKVKSNHYTKKKRKH